LSKPRRPHSLPTRDARFALFNMRRDAGDERDLQIREGELGRSEHRSEQRRTGAEIGDLLENTVDQL
jgi:hypothetical protein